MNRSLLCIRSFNIFFCILLIFSFSLTNFFYCRGLVLLLFLILSIIFSFLTGLSSLPRSLDFWHQALPVGDCSLECNNNNNSIFLASVCVLLLLLLSFGSLPGFSPDSYHQWFYCCMIPPPAS